MHLIGVLFISQEVIILTFYSIYVIFKYVCVHTYVYLCVFVSLSKGHKEFINYIIHLLRYVLMFFMCFIHPNIIFIFTDISFTTRDNSYRYSRTFWLPLRYIYSPFRVTIFLWLRKFKLKLHIIGFRLLVKYVNKIIIFLQRS